MQKFSANIYRISAHWNAMTSNLHGAEYTSERAAREAIGAGSIWISMDGEYSRQWTVYSSRSDAIADRDGRAPHLAIAAVYKLSAKDQAHERAREDRYEFAR